MEELKKQIHEIIDSIEDENWLHAILEIALRYKSKEDSKVIPMKMPNGSIAWVKPGDPSVNSDDMFSIWKDNPITLEELREKAWGKGRY